jgi:hypothetical protein
LDPFALSMAEINCFSKTILKELKAHSSEGDKSDPSPRLFVVKNGRCIQHVFEGGGSFSFLLQIAKCLKQPYNLSQIVLS